MKIDNRIEPIVRDILAAVVKRDGETFIPGDGAAHRRADGDQGGTTGGRYRHVRDP
jgi:hypothetical protein